MSRNIGCFITHNTFAPLASALTEANQTISKTLKSPTFPEKIGVNFHYSLLPVYTSENSSIDTRSKKLYEKISDEIEKNKLDQIHLISHGLSGLDTRLMMSEYSDINRICGSLVTICSPHRGSLLADIILKNEINRFVSDRLTAVLGLSPESFAECNRDNMRDMNHFLGDFTDERIHTITASKEYTSLSTLFRAVTDRILETENLNNLDTDGVFLSHECTYNNERRLGVFPADHYQLSCFASDMDNKKVYAMALDFCANRSF